ncbi:radical SAM protein [Fundidesulfovibrio terrae]|uniref:radical SAM protein n=1 Tax=Fundidesulfovibrio terrae TaxID=2922866 RepID=UPI001FAED1AA|nr:radical SAM protein [Fundidesulfovibrio terrae]
MTGDSCVYLHEPGRFSPRGVLDVGLKCPHSCKFCYYSYWDKTDSQFGALRKAAFRPGGDCKAILSAFAAQGLGFYDVTGGEPCAHPDMPDVVAHGTSLGLKGRIITLGQLLTGRDRLLDRLLDAGLTDFLFSMHAVDEERFKSFTGGSWNRLSGVLDELEGRGFAYGANSVIFEGNLDHLEDIARESARRLTYVHNFIVFNAYHEWNSRHRAAGVQARYRDVAPRIARAVEILDGAGVAVNIRYVPLCVFPGLTRHVVGLLGLPYDPFEWRNRACNPDREPAYCAEILPIPESGVRERFAFAPLEERLPNGTGLMGMRGERFTVFPAKCASCAALPACDGVDPKYLERNGDAEFMPFPSMDLSGPLLRARMEYARAFAVKLTPDVDVRKALGAALAG